VATSACARSEQQIVVNQSVTTLIDAVAMTASTM
jgi:hypothetical protein